MRSLTIRPQQFSPDFEKPSPEESEINQGIMDALQQILKKT